MRKECLGAEGINRLSLTGNGLKVLAAVTMTVDHVGMLFLPHLLIFRYVGRIAFPIFAFMIAEGCAHSHNRLRYLRNVAILALLCQSVSMVALEDLYLAVPVSFGAAILLVIVLENYKKAAIGGFVAERNGWVALFAGGVTALWLLSRMVDIEYGFWGCMLPVGASLFRMPEGAPQNMRKLDRNLTHILSMGIFLVLLAVDYGSWQWWSLLSLPLLACYNGCRGKYKMKGFFYVYYPAHMLVLFGLAMLR